MTMKMMRPIAKGLSHQRQRRSPPLTRAIMMMTMIIVPAMHMMVIINSFVSFACAQDNSLPYLLGNFTTRAHDVAGTVYVISDHILEITGFTYDGEGPAGYFHIDSTPVPSANGTRLLDSVGEATPSCGTMPLMEADGTDVYRVEFPSGTSIQDYLGGSFSVWCETAVTNFGEVVIPSTLPASISSVDDTSMLVCSMESEVAEPYLLGNFTTRAHDVAGTVYVISDHILEITGFVYDGQGPAGYFHVDTNPVPSAFGDRLLDSEGGNSPSCGTLPLVEADGTDVYRVEFPPGTSIQDYLGGSFSVWCEIALANFGEVLIPDTLPTSISAVDDSSMLVCTNSSTVNSTDIPSFVATPNGYNCEPLSEIFQVRWAVDENNDMLLMELIGIIEDGQYMSFGTSGNATSTFMIGADIVVADNFGGSYRARDFYISDRAQCSSGVGVCHDTDTDGGTDDVNATTVSGEMEQGITIIRYQKPITTTDDSSIDKPISIVAGDNTFIVWAIGTTSTTTGNPLIHVSYTKGDVSIDFGRSTVDNCEPFMVEPITDASPTTTFEVPLLQNVTEFVATIGPSGGARGYMGITGQTGWGIAWYINDLLIPVIEMRRGTTYTFHVHGGNESGNSAEYHPFYLTSSKVGGYQQANATFRSMETVYAGIDNKIFDVDGTSVLNFTTPYIAPICLYTSTDASDNAAMTGSFSDYFETLDVSCKDDKAIMDQGATFQFTPNASTPDVIYYQCVTHQNLGWKIMVIDADDAPLVGPSGKAPVAAPTPSITSSATTFVIISWSGMSLVLGFVVFALGF